MLTLRALPQEAIPRVYALMRRDFPQSELKPLDTLMRLVRKGVYDALGAYDGETLCGYAMLFRRRGGRMPLLDYLAVSPERRGQGVGGAMLGLLRARYHDADALLIECERAQDAPDADAARRRLRFYARAGALQTGLRATLFGVEFVILCLPCAGGGLLADVQRHGFLVQVRPEKSDQLTFSESCGQFEEKHR